MGSLFGIHSYGRQAHIFTMTNRHGWSVDLTNLGAAVRSVNVPGRDGRMTDVVVCHGSFEDCMTNRHDLGAVCGRISGRLGKPGFRLGDRYCKVPLGHGRMVDVKPFSCSVWKAEPSAGDAVTFSLSSPDGEQGLPGNLDVDVTYTWNDEGRLGIDYTASADADTAVDLSCNLFVNLGGFGGETILDHRLAVFADSYLAAGGDMCVTGDIVPVRGKPVDLNSPVTIGGRVSGEYYFANLSDLREAVGGGGSLEGQPRLRARVFSPQTGIGMNMYTDGPVIRLDTGASLMAYRGKRGVPCKTNGALCVAAGMPPDAAAGELGFLSSVLRAGEVYRRRTEYVFTVEKG
ncbi:MAG: hypothetical protein FWH06_03410 [Oscillospiraceae bacterium]|nr:hypothetical protein [Oscillospiraceae bacterium]